jgi:hypothetical protein
MLEYIECTEKDFEKEQGQGRALVVVPTYLFSDQFYDVEMDHKGRR